jgi:hypothetical protein
MGLPTRRLCCRLYRTLAYQLMFAMECGPTCDSVVTMYLRTLFLFVFYVIACGLTACSLFRPALISKDFIAGHTTRISATACSERRAIVDAENAGKEHCKGKRIYHQEVSTRLGIDEDLHCGQASTFVADLIIDCQ